MYIASWYFTKPLRPTQPDVPLWVGKMSTSSGYGYHW